MTRRAVLSRTGGLWCVSLVSAPHRGGARPALHLGACPSRAVAVALWLACQGIPDAPETAGHIEGGRRP